MQSKQELDIYIDETGDSSPYCIENPLYIISFVCVEPTDQNVNSIQSFQQKLSGHNGGDHFIHTGNLVRKEHPYKELTIQERQSLFGCMFFFSKKARFRYFNAVIDKKSHQEKPLCERASAGLVHTLESHKGYLGNFSIVRVHYDGGQAFLSDAISASCRSILPNWEYITTKQEESPFMQLADMLGFMELIWHKANQGSLTKSDVLFFGKKRKIHKDYIKFLETKKF